MKIWIVYILIITRKLQMNYHEQQATIPLEHSIITFAFRRRARLKPRVISERAAHSDRIVVWEPEQLKKGVASGPAAAASGESRSRTGTGAAEASA